VKINLAQYDLTEPAHVAHVGGVLGEAFGRDVLLPMLDQLPMEHRLHFFLAIFSYPIGLVSGTFDAQTAAEFFAKLKFIEATVREHVGAMPAEARH
jgi:hypothetical protein